MDQSIASHSSTRTFWTTDDIRSKIEKSKVVVFSKGDAEHPRCGYSQRAIEAVEHCGKPFEVVDVCLDSSIVAALRHYSGRKSLPLVYVDGELISSSETLTRMVDTGELQDKVNKAFSHS